MAEIGGVSCIAECEAYSLASPLTDIVSESATGISKVQEL